MSNPVDEGAILQYLSSGVIKGIGASTGHKNCGALWRRYAEGNRG